MWSTGMYILAYWYGIYLLVYIYWYIFTGMYLLAYIYWYVSTDIYYTGVYEVYKYFCYLTLIELSNDNNIKPGSKCTFCDTSNLITIDCYGSYELIYTLI